MTDEDLMEAVKNGDLRQSAPLFDRYHKPIFHFLARMTGDAETAEDLTQNVFLRMLKYKKTYKEGHSFRSWIYQIARNEFSDHYYQASRTLSSRLKPEAVSDRLEDSRESQEQEHRERILHESMERLPQDQRELLVLTRFQRMKYEEVAEILDTTVANIKVKVHRAIQKLREHYFQIEKV
jgi:RNA polymerase sigma-70 factor (ECF subfamily)